MDEKREVFHLLEDELQKGKAVSERMLRTHNERDMDMDWHKEKAVQLAERWESIRSQIDNRSVLAITGTIGCVSLKSSHLFSKMMHWLLVSD